MKIQRILLYSIVIIFCASASVFASEKTHREAVKELVEMIDADKMIDSIYESMNANMVQNMIKQHAAIESIKKPLTDLITKYYQKILSAPLLKGKIQELYAEEFTEEEVRAIIDFYKTPVGRKIFEKTPLLTAKTMQIAQDEIKKAYENGTMAELRNEINQLVKDIEPK